MYLTCPAARDRGTVAVQPGGRQRRGAGGASYSSQGGAGGKVGDFAIIGLSTCADCTRPKSHHQHQASRTAIVEQRQRHANHRGQPVTIAIIPPKRTKETSFAIPIVSSAQKRSLLFMAERRRRTTMIQAHKGKERERADSRNSSAKVRKDKVRCAFLGKKFSRFACLHKAAARSKPARSQRNLAS